MRAPLLAVAAVFAAGCGATRSDVAPLEAAAARAYGSGRYGEAAAHWRDAARATQSQRERDEALYREATSLARDGRFSDAIAVYDSLLRDFPRADRAPRAAFDRANLVISLGNVDGGHADLDRVVRGYPNSGVAAAALAEMVRFLAVRGDGKVRDYLTELGAALGSTELGPDIYYALAESLEQSGDLEGARDRYLFVAEQYPYPKDPLWDDALWHAADLDQKLGDPQTAILHLKRMLRERETSYVEGSYERGRYASAKFRIAELYRDALSNPAEARKTFEELFRDHPDSRLRDDAAWNAATLAATAGDAEGACSDLRQLIQAIPTSRYVACAPKLCPSVGLTSEPCHEYLVRRGNP